jgi:glycosyltransferase involved in cell wall biosynthesis
VHACTIVSRRALPYARVTSSTLREHHPDASLTILVLDAEPGEIPTVAGAQVLDPQSVVGEEWGLVAAANAPGALAVAALPYLMRAVLDAHDGSATFIGAGARVLAPMTELEGMLAEHEIVLVARAGGGASVVAHGDTHARGTYSRQLLGLRAGPSTAALLKAWPRYFTIAADEGAAAVRAWVDSLPARYRDVGVLQDPGYGLDQWSLASRSVTFANQGFDGLAIDGRPARVLDFSELDPDDLASWSDGEDRICLSSAPPLARLAERQAEDLTSAGAQAYTIDALPYARLCDGMRLTDTIRTLLVESILEGSVRRSPFCDQGRAELYRYLNKPAQRGRGAKLTRLHLAIWERRDDLRATYAHIDGPDGGGFAGWLCAHGPAEEGLVPELLPPAPDLLYRDADPHSHELGPRRGVNLVGFFTSELGVGEAARALMSSLDACAVPALPIQGHLVPPSRQDEAFTYFRPDQAAFPINIICINGDGVPVFAREAGRGFFEGRYTIALWFWEVGDPPASWKDAYEFIDEVWVPSRHVYDLIAPESPVPVVRIRLPVAEPEVAQRTRADLGLPDAAYTFLYVYDYHSVAKRKNPLGAIEAFRRAFSPGSGVKLVLKSINGENRRDEHERVLLAASAHEDIRVLNAYVSNAEKNAMIAACDCYLSLHRSEGFGLTVAEAMLLGKPVISTRYGGTMEFTNDENAYLVDYTSISVGERAYPYAADDVWADPNLDQAAALMQHVVADRRESNRRGELARRHIVEQHSPAVAGEAIAQRLAFVSERLYEQGARSVDLARLPSSRDADIVPEKIADPPRVEWGPGQLGRLKRRAHRPVSNWIGDYLKHERAIDTELHATVVRLDAQLREIARTLQDQQNASHAEILAVLRSLETQLSERGDPSK